MFLIIEISISTPVTGVVGFVIQLREVKKGCLENKKLQLRFAGNASTYLTNWLGGIFVAQCLNLNLVGCITPAVS